MKFVAVIAVVMQLIARGAAGPHCHAHAGHSENPEHRSRPHFHLNGHTHSVSDKHQHHTHSHCHHEQTPNCDVADGSQTHLTSQHSSDHDEDSVYVNDDPLTVATERSELIEFSDVTWCRSTRDAGLTATHSGRIEGSARGLSNRSTGILFTLLGHVLRV